MWPFEKKNNEKQLALPASEMEHLISVLDLVKSGKINEAIENEVRKAFSFTDFQQMEGFHGDETGHFGTEFDLRTTAARIKMLHAREPWVYATSSLIARTMSSIKFNIHDSKTDEIRENHPAEKIVSGGNPMQDGIHKSWSGYLDLVLGGNYFEILDENYKYSAHIPIELAQPVLRKTDTAEQMRQFERLGPFEWLEIYDMATGKISKRILWEHVIHHKFPNPFNPFIGLSMYVAAARPILLDRHKNEFEMAFYLRGATNAGVIETTEDITKSRMERLMRTFESSFTGKRNWWRTLFLPKGAKWVNSGLSMKEMDHLEGLRENRRTLLAVLGIPPSQIGIVEDVNRATAEVQETAFWQNTIIPLAGFIASGYNNSHLFKHIFSGDVYVKPDFSNVDAVEGSMFTKAERAKALDNIAVLNEQREIAGLDPLPDGDPRGQMLLAEIEKLDPMAAVVSGDGGDGGKSHSGGLVAVETGPSSGTDAHTHVAEFDPLTGIGKTIATNGAYPDHVHRIRPRGQTLEILEVEPATDDGHTHPDIDRGAEQRSAVVSQIKKNATQNQSRIEKIQTEKYLKSLTVIRDDALATAIRALRDRRPVKTRLDSTRDERGDKYREMAMPTLVETMERGWDMAMAQTRSLTNAIRTKTVKQSERITADDEQALNAIRERTADDRRRQLDDRNIQAFKGFDETQTEQIVKIVENGLRDGKTFDEIAATIRADYGENYGDQAFTIARTETLTAVSAGIKANHDALNQVYSKVDKQWFHIGDVGVNPDARVQHLEFEKAGVVPSKFIWTNPDNGAQLMFPRDPNGGASEVINCRCTMVSIIPDDATSSVSDFIE